MGLCAGAIGNDSSQSKVYGAGASVNDSSQSRVYGASLMEHTEENNSIKCVYI